MERYVPWSICKFIVQRSGAEFRLDMSQREAKGCVQYLDGWMDGLLAKPQQVRQRDKRTALRKRIVRTEGS
jgi:hypothetical protein